MTVLGIEFVQDPKYPNHYTNRELGIDLFEPCERGELWEMEDALGVEGQGSSPMMAARDWAENCRYIANKHLEKIPEGW